MKRGSIVINSEFNLFGDKDKIDNFVRTLMSIYEYHFPLWYLGKFPTKFYWDFTEELH